MDGIEREKSKSELKKLSNQAKIHDEEQAINEVQDKTKTLQKALSPIKEGLADSTLKIFKACLKVVKDHHFKALGKMDKDDFKYIPTLCVLFEMKEMFMITEQINTVLFGVSYMKKDTFIKSEKFQEVVDCILEFEKRELKIDAEDEASDSENDNIIEEDKNISSSSSEKANKRREEIENNVNHYLTKSNEKWVLDQYNLCKRFLIQNSIQGNYDEFYHPVYERFEQIKNLKKKCRNLEVIGSSYK